MDFHRQKSGSQFSKTRLKGYRLFLEDTFVYVSLFVNVLSLFLFLVLNRAPAGRATTTEQHTSLSQLSTANEMTTADEIVGLVQPR